MDNMHAYKRIQPMIANDEELLWSGQPKGGVLFRDTDLYSIPFSLLWGGFSIFWLYVVIISEADFKIFFIMGGIPFVCVGLYMMVGRFFWDWHNRKNTFYGVTDKRIVMITIFKTETLSIDALGAVRLKLKKDGSGTIELGTDEFISGLLKEDLSFTKMYTKIREKKGNVQYFGKPLVTSLEFIEDAKSVHDLIVKFL